MRVRYSLIKTYKPVLGTTAGYRPGAKKIFPSSWDMAAFDYRQAQEIRDIFAQHGVHYLFIGKSGAILLGFPDTTQDPDLFPERSAENGSRLASALRQLGFAFAESQAACFFVEAACVRRVAQPAGALLPLRSGT